MKTISLDLHDFSVENNNLFYIYKLKEQYPGFKVSMFYIPVDVNYYARLMPEMKEIAKKDVVKAVKEGWLELIPHGLSHIFGEFQKADEKSMELAIEAYEKHFEELGVPYVKGFCAPNWLMSQAAIKVLDKHGWWLAIDRNQPDAFKAKRNYIYNWDIVDPFPKDLDVVMGHGHISGPSRNSIAENFLHISHVPPEYEWKFVSEMMKDA